MQKTKMHRELSTCGFVVLLIVGERVISCAFVNCVELVYTNCLTKQKIWIKHLLFGGY